MTGTKEASKPIVLRKNLPFYCLAKDADGKAIHLDHPLAETDGTLCQVHAAAEKEVAAEREKRALAAEQARKKFMEAPIAPKAPVTESMDQMMARRAGRPPFWP